MKFSIYREWNFAIMLMTYPLSLKLLINFSPLSGSHILIFILFYLQIFFSLLPMILTSYCFIMQVCIHSLNLLSILFVVKGGDRYFNKFLKPVLVTPKLERLFGIKYAYCYKFKNIGNRKTIYEHCFVKVS